MFYVVVVVIPLAVAALCYLTTKRSGRYKSHLLLSLFKSLPFQYGYLFLVYILEMEGYIESNWQFYSLAFFLIPISVILLAAHFLFNRKPSTDQ